MVADPLTKTTTTAYDARGRVSITSPGGTYTEFVIWPGTPLRSESYTYDEVGRLRTRTDRRSVVTTFTYDAADRLLQKSYSDGTPPVNYTYDPVGPPAHGRQRDGYADVDLRPGRPGAVGGQQPIGLAGGVPPRRGRQPQGVEAER